MCRGPLSTKRLSQSPYVSFIPLCPVVECFSFVLNLFSLLSLLQSSFKVMSALEIHDQGPKLLSLGGRRLIQTPKLILCWLLGKERLIFFVCFPSSQVLLFSSKFWNREGIIITKCHSLKNHPGTNGTNALPELGP